MLLEFGLEKVKLNMKIGWKTYAWGQLLGYQTFPSLLKYNAASPSNYMNIHNRNSFNWQF